MQVSGLETDLAMLWHAVESHGGLQQVMDKNRWSKVIEMLKIPIIVSSHCKSVIDASSLLSTDVSLVFPLSHQGWIWLDLRP